MEKYDHVAYELARHLTISYSTSFGMSSRLFDVSIRSHIYAVYGLVRVADEIVDSYKGSDAETQLNNLEAETYEATRRGFSANLIVHSFAKTARAFGIDKTLITPFFNSMRMDLSPTHYTSSNYKDYIHGSAEVVGLMCLRVFCANDAAEYKRLQKGAIALGSAYQKVNFLRDFAADYRDLKRVYFPGVQFDTFNDSQKQAITSDIKQDFTIALPALRRLPKNAKAATMTSYVYYSELLKLLEKASVNDIKQNRLSVPPARKVLLLATTALKEKLHA